MSSEREIRLLESEDGIWTARDLDAEVSAQGETRAAALSALDEVVAAVEDDGGRAPTDADLEAVGIDPAANDHRRESPRELPEELE